MRFIHESGFTVKIGQDEAHQRWLIENEEKLAKSYPEGTRLHRHVLDGVQHRQAGRNVPDVRRARQLWRDGSDGSGGDYDLNAPWSLALRKAVVDATVWDPPTG